VRWTVENINDLYIIVRTFGEYSSKDQIEMVTDILSKEFWRPGMPAIFDHRQLNLGGASFHSMMSARDGHAKHDDKIGKSKTALVVGDTAAYGTARQFQNIADGVIGAEIKVFLSYEDAETWIKNNI